MASIQELEVRLKGLEEKVKFMLDIAQVTASLSTGLVDQDGREMPPKIFKGSMAEMFKLSRQYPTFLASDRVEERNGDD